MANAMKRASGQVMVFFALVLPLVLLPIAAYAVDSTVAASDYSRLVEVTVLAADDAAQQVDVTALRAGDAIVLDPVAAATVARSDVATLASARVERVSVLGDVVSVSTTEEVELPLDFLGRGTMTLTAGATARIAAGYDRPSSLLPLPVSSF